MSGPLSGIKVLDLSRVLAGPYCTQMLADLGAEVWKIEALQGDDTRRWGPPFEQGESGYYLSINRGKKSLAIDLKDPRGQEAVRGLALRADVLIENFKAGDLARYGLDYATLAPLNPRLIYASITGFGQTGPRANEPGYDAALQGLAGVMSITGEPDGPPEKVGVAWVDVLTGVHAAVGVLAALHERERRGRGQHLDLALFDVALASLVNQAQSYLMTGVAPQRLGNMHPQVVPYGAFEAEDGWLMLAIGNDAQFRRACAALSLPELGEDERFMDNRGRVANRDELECRIADRLRTAPRRFWLQRLGVAGVPATPVNTIAEAFADHQVEARGMRWRVPHPLLGDLEMVGSPFSHLSRTPASPSGPPPLLGGHTRELLGLAGFSTEEIEELELAGIVRQAKE